MCQLKRQTKPSVILLLSIALSTRIVFTALGQGVTIPGPSPTASGSLLYTCPMHPDVRAATPGNCVQCGMSLVGTAATSEVMDYELRLETTPTAVKAGDRVQLRILVFHPKTGEQVKEFEVVHDMPFHLFIVGRDLENYQHIHPTQQQDGGLTTQTVLPAPGHYEIFCDFFPTGGAPQVIHRSLATDGISGGGRHALQSALEPDRSLIRSVAGIRFELRPEPAHPVAGQPTLLKYYLVDDAAELPVQDLQPYLGAWGHTVSLREGATDFLHAHPTGLIPAGADRSRLLSGPRVSFKTFFARPGHHRIWSQFQRKGKVITVSFTVYVSRLDRIAKWDGRGWSSAVDSPVNGVDGAVRALAASERDLYLGGDFAMVDGTRANGVAKWNGHEWSGLGGGVKGRVWAIAVRGKEVYVGGDFTEAGGKPAQGIARWDGRSWSALSSGITGSRDHFATPTVYALAVRGRNVYVGGQFAMAGGVTANGIAMWDGHTWTALGGGVRTGTDDGVVRDLALRGRDLYAGGQFITAGDVSAHNIAKWNGRRWSALGSGVRGNLETVLTIGVQGRDVYVGGMFTMAGGLRASNLAKWNGTNWSAFDVQTYDGVREIAVSGRNVYVGGATFFLPGGLETKGIVKWDGGNWGALGPGIGQGRYTGPILAIASRGSTLYVGGDVFSLPGPVIPGREGRIGRSEADPRQ